MRDTALFRRTLAAVGLVAAAVLSVLWSALQPPFGDGYAERLAEIDAGGTAAAVSAVLFVASQIPMLAGMLGVAHLLRRRSPVLSNLGGVAATLGVLGHCVFGGFALVQVRMAQDEENRELYAALIEDVESSAFMAFAALGLLGTVLGMLLLSIGAWRAQVAPRWAPVAWWLFLVVEFVGTGLSEQAVYASSALLALVFGALALTVWRSPRSEWEIAAPTPHEDGIATAVEARA